MREYKFRAWEKNLKQIIPVHNISFENKMINTDSAWRLFDEIELMQYTGLNDVYGKDIFEGDIIDDKHGLKGKVFFKNCSFRVTSTHIDINDEEYYDVMNLDLIKDNQIYVIGNIYENPELLK